MKKINLARDPGAPDNMEWVILFVFVVLAFYLIDKL